MQNGCQIRHYVSGNLYWKIHTSTRIITLGDRDATLSTSGLRVKVPSSCFIISTSTKLSRPVQHTEMRACLSLYCVTGFSFGRTKLTKLFALVCGSGAEVCFLWHTGSILVHCSFVHCSVSAAYFELILAELKMMLVLKQREAARGFTDEVDTHLTLVPLGNQFGLSLWSAICPLSQTFPVRCMRWWSNKTRIKALV